MSKSLYVDDFAIYCSSRRPELAHRQLQLCLHHLQLWTEQTGLEFSPQKTVSLHMCRVRNCPRSSPNLELSGVVLRHVETCKFLGMIIDSSLTWRCHLSQLKYSCMQSLNLLRHISHTSFGADRVTLLRLYLALIKPKLDYGSEAYGSACTSLLDTLQPIQNAALRIATGAYRTSPVASLHAETGILPLKYYRDTKALTYLSRLRTAEPPYILEILQSVDRPLFERNHQRAHPFLLRMETALRRYDVALDGAQVSPPRALPPWQTYCIFACEKLSHLK